MSDRCDHPPLSSQLWIDGESGATIRPTVPLQPLLTVRTGAPHVHISNVRLFGGLEVEGGDLELVGCSIEPDDSANGHAGATGRRLKPSPGERALSIDGGRVSLMRVVLTGHAAGAVSAQAAARLTMVESTTQGNRAQRGGAIRVSQGSFAWLERCNLTDNVADESGGALQARQPRSNGCS